KVWFGRNRFGETVDLEDMTYGEVVRRMVDLLYVRHESRWIDASYKKFTGDFIHRVEERFTSKPGQASLLQDFGELESPYETVKRILAGYPEADTQIINAQDVQHFLMLCRRRGQKPPTFDLAQAQAERNFWKARAVTQGASEEEWDVVPEGVRDDLVADFRIDPDDLLLPPEDDF
ncbi:hypothetical protein BN1723_000828, partial [Verticillium longisporum]